MSHLFKHFIADPKPSGRRNNPAPRFWSWVVAMVWVMLAGFSGSQAWALSLDSMQVKSNFGERFNARILLSGPASEDLRVTIGTVEDYNRLGLERPNLVDQLYVKMHPAADGNAASIGLLSDRPLFYPSFNLVVKMQSGGRTLYENYLITVDFRQSVSLKLKADQPEKQKEEPEVEPKPVPKNEEVALAEKEIPDSPVPPEKNVRTVVAVHPTPLIVREISQPDYVAALPRPRPEFEEPTHQASLDSSPEPENMKDKTASAIGLLTQILQEIPSAVIAEPAPEACQSGLSPQ